MIIWRAGYQVGGATEEVVTVLGSPDKDVQFGAAIAATDDDGAAPDPPPRGKMEFPLGRGDTLGHWGEAVVDPVSPGRGGVFKLLIIKVAHRRQG